MSNGTQPQPQSISAGPTLRELAARIGERNPRQGKYIGRFLTAQDADYLRAAEATLTLLGEHLRRRGHGPEYLVDSYLELCAAMLREQLAFQSAGQFSRTSEATVGQDVYDNRQVMESYMAGLALSIFLWPNHYAIYRIYREGLAMLPPPATGLEIGPGHGLYLLAARQRFPAAQFTAIDVSMTALEFSRGLNELAPAGPPVVFLHQDLRTYQPPALAELVVAGEVIEHLEDPLAGLGRLRAALQPAGACFISTCANLPAIDHLYCYRDAEHIRDHITRAGFTISREAVLPIPGTTGAESRPQLNYAAWLAVSPVNG